MAEDDLWFLPGPEEEQPTDFLSPRRAVQAALAPDLADLAVQFGALDERLRAGPVAWVHRLALLEVAEQGRWAGDRIGAERLALWTGLRMGATGDDTQALARAGWAVRRLGVGHHPAKVGGCRAVRVSGARYCGK